VKIAMKSAMIKGTFVYRAGDKSTISRTLASGNSQIPYSNGPGGGGGASTVGSYQQILNAFSILWNGKPCVIDHTIQTRNFGVNSAGTSTSGGFVGEVDYITRSYHIKNNYNFVLHTTIYDCLRKRDNMDTENALAQGALSQWSFALTSEQAIASTTDYNTGPNIGQAGQGAVFANPVTTSTLGATPMMCKAFMRNWSVSHETVQLEPGQTFDFTIKVPGFKFDQSKYLQPGTTSPAAVYDLLKGITHDIIFVSYPEFQQTKAGIGGYFGVTASAAYGGSAGLWITWTDHYALKCPELTAVVNPVVGIGGANETVSAGSLRRPAYIFLNNVGTSDNSTTDPVTRADEETAIFTVTD